MEDLKTMIIVVSFCFLVVVTSRIGEKMYIEYKISRVKEAYIREYKRYVWELKETKMCTLNVTEPRKLKIPYIRNNIGTFRNNTELRKSFIMAGYMVREIFEKYDHEDYEIEQIFAEIRRIAFSNGEVTSKDLLF